jgi:CheY-like chemotaxis protein
MDKTISILAIDDEPVCLDIIKFSLESMGYIVYVAETGNEAVDFLKENVAKIDIILLDMMMPALSGLETASLIRRIKGAESIPIILQTGAANYSDMNDDSSLGLVNDVIVKPFKRHELYDKIRQVLCKQDEKTKMVS